MTALRFVVLLMVTMFFPPLGAFLFLVWAFVALSKRVGKGGGVQARRKADAWAAQPPQWHQQTVL